MLLYLKRLVILWAGYLSPSFRKWWHYHTRTWLWGLKRLAEEVPPPPRTPSGESVISQSEWASLLDEVFKTGAAKPRGSTC
jgi:hypothetical protein